jgi:hypothetical protein
MWKLYRTSDHAQDCTQLQGEAENQLFFCAAADMKQVDSTPQGWQVSCTPQCPLGRPLSLLLVLRPCNLWSGVTDEQGHKGFGATWSCQAFRVPADQA